MDVAVKTKKYVWSGNQYERNGQKMQNYQGIYGNESYGDVGYNEGALVSGAGISGTNYEPYIEVTLKVWPGQFGQNVDSKALVYYGEFENPGDL